MIYLVVAIILAPFIFWIYERTRKEILKRKVDNYVGEFIETLNNNRNVCS